MKTRLLYLWDLLRESYWFVPTLMTLGAFVAAYGFLQIDYTFDDFRGIHQLEWVYKGGPEGARAVLTTVAGSMITVAGVVFSITIVALTLASSQFGPRLLRNFIRDRRNQFVLGTFVSTFVYCLLILRTISGPDENGFVPNLSVTVGVFFALLSLGVLIYFIHHVATSIQANQVINSVGDELCAEIPKLFPGELGKSPADLETTTYPIPERFEEESQLVIAEGSGYLVGVQSGTMLELACQHDIIVQLEVRPGDFIIKGTELARVWPGQALTDELVDRINHALVIGSQATRLQDIEFTMNQLVEIAVRALSPSINDPFTAVACVHRLGEAFCLLAEREWPSAYRFDKEKSLRVIAEPINYADLAEKAFGPIRRYGLGSGILLGNLAETLARVVEKARRSSDRQAIRNQLKWIAQAANEGLTLSEDRDAIQKICEEALKEETQVG